MSWMEYISSKESVSVLFFVLSVVVVLVASSSFLYMVL